MSIAAILKEKGRDVIGVPPDETIAEVTRTLARHRIGAVLVMDEREQVLGILSERDIVRSLANNGAAVLHMTAGQLMTRALRTANPRMAIAEAMEIMTSGRFRHLPVMEHGVLVGMISIGDVVKHRINEAEQEAESLKAYVAGAA